MTDDGVLFIQEHLPHVLGDEIEEALDGAGLSTDFRLSGEGRYEPDPRHGWGNIERRWPSSAEIPIVQYEERVGTVHIELASVVKHDMTGAEYVGKEVSDYEIIVDGDGN